ncbi:MAG: hypothetical protein AAGK78_15005, partial [Planctomycetota bacterium]
RDWANFLLWAEGELPAAEVAVLQRRVATDEKLAAEMERAFAFSASMRRATDEPVPNFVAESAARRASALTAAFAAQPADERQGKTAEAPPVESDAASLAWRIGRWPLAAAATLVVGLMIYGLRPPPTQRPLVVQPPINIDDTEQDTENTRGDRDAELPDNFLDDATNLARLFNVPFDNATGDVSPSSSDNGAAFESLGTSAQLAALDQRLTSLRAMDDDPLVDLEFGDDLFDGDPFDDLFSDFETDG